RPRLVSFLVHWHNWITAKIAVELARGAAFLCLPVLMGLGVILYYAFPAEPAAIAILSTAVCLALATWLSRSRSLLFFVLAALLAVVLGARSAKFEVWRASPPMVGSDISTRLTGRVVTTEHQATGRTRLTRDVMATER